MPDSEMGQFTPVDASWNRPDDNVPTTRRSGFLAHNSGRRNHVRGVARQIKERSERLETIWDFSLERYDEAGNRLQPMAVELRSTHIVGRLNEGDWVEVVGPWKKGRTRVVTEVWDMTTHTLVGKQSRGCGWFLAIFIGVVLFIALPLMVFQLRASSPLVISGLATLALIYVFFVAVAMIRRLRKHHYED